MSDKEPPYTRDDVVSLDSPMEKLKIVWTFMTERAPVYFDACLSDHMAPLTATAPTDTEPGRATFSLKVPRSLCNAGNNLHGGAVALIFDMCTSMAVIVSSREGFWDTGHVSRTLNCTYLRPAPEGTELIVETEVVHLGNQMGYLTGVIRRKDNGKICYTCEHGKAKVDFPTAGRKKSKL